MAIDQSPQAQRREVWRHSDGWVSRSVNGRVFVGAREGSEMTLEGPAAVVWVALDEPTSRDELVELICDVLPVGGVTPSTVDDAIKVLLEHGLVTSDGQPVRTFPQSSDG